MMTPERAHLLYAAALCGPSALALGLTALNMVVWPRWTTRADAEAIPRVSVLIPARNEEDTIEAAVRAALAQDVPLHEVIVIDDQSSDATPEILARLASEDPRLRVLDGSGPPPGWVGKPHACHRLAEAATGDVLCFVDADTFLTPQAVALALGQLDHRDADALTAVPRQLTGSWAERLILPLLHLTYTSWLPLPLVWLSRDPRFLAANGQLLMVRREAYDAIGGFASVRDAVIDDMAFCGRLKRAGRRLVFTDGFELASCRMYTDARGVWEGFSKNIYAGLGFQPLALLMVLTLYFVAFVAPYLALPALLLSAPAHPLVPFAALAVLINITLRALLTARFHHAPEGVVLHPLAVLGLLAIAVNSWRWSALGTIRWSGRVYPAASPPALRATPSPGDPERGGAEAQTL